MTRECYPYAMGLRMLLAPLELNHGLVNFLVPVLAQVARRAMFV